MAQTAKLENIDDQELFLIDGSGFIFRAFHALPPLTRPSDKTPVGAVMGFCNMIFKLLSDHPDARVAVIFDATRHNFRNEIYPAYKANRSETPEDLIPQFPLIREATAAFGLPCLELDGYEADDLIATYARCAREKGIKAVIVSSDKDLMQLVYDGQVRMLDPIKQTYIGEEQVFEKFGVKPDKVTDIQALAGDSIDNVPGVPGIGIKTAAELINLYGDLEGLIANISQIKQPKRRETLENNIENARISKKLVVLDENVPIPIPLDDLKPEHPFSEKLISFLQYQGFKTLVSRISARTGIDTSETAKPLKRDYAAPSVAPSKPAVQIDVEKNYELITTEDRLKFYIEKAYETGILAFDTETTDLTPAKANLCGISLSYAPGQACYIAVGHCKGGDLFGDHSDTPAQLKKARVIELLKPILEDQSVLKVAHNMKYDWQMLAKEGVDTAPCDDTILMSYVCDGTQHGHGLDELAQLFFDHKMTTYDEVTGTGKNRITFDQVELQKAALYAAEDADYTLRLYNHFKPLIAQNRVSVIYEDIERPLCPIIAQMELDGIKVDLNVLKSLSHKFGEKIAQMEKEIYKDSGHEFNIGSPKQLGAVLFDSMGLPGGGKTKTGEWSTAVDVLEDLAAQGHEFVRKILTWRQLSKLKSTYTEALQLAAIPATSRVHTSYAMALTSTGRLSSSDPNLQNIPIRTEEGKMIRTAFVAEEGKVLLSADYSQIELRLVAEMAGIKALQQAFRDNIDIHSATASQVFDVPLDQMTSDIRRKAKAINFGIIYGISGFGLANQLGISNSEASMYIKQYFARFPELANFMEETKTFARENGYVKTLLGRKCFIPGIQDKNPARRSGAERQAINAPVQGTAADLIKLAMVRLDRLIKGGELDAKMLLQVHDELVFEIPEDQAEAMAPIIKREMEAVANFSVPLVVETGIAKNWADAH